MKVTIKNKGTKVFPLIQIYVDGKEFCSTSEMSIANKIMHLLTQSEVKSNEVNPLNSDTVELAKAENESISQESPLVKTSV